MDKQSNKRELEKKLQQFKRDNGQHVVSDDFYTGVFEKLGCEPNTSFKILGEGFGGADQDQAFEKVVVGIAREPLDFLKRAVNAGGAMQYVCGRTYRRLWSGTEMLMHLQFSLTGLVL